MIATLVSLFQSEVFVQVFALGTVVLLCALTYILGFKSNASTNDNSSQEKQQQSAAPRQTANVGNKTKRLSKQETTPPATVPTTPKTQVKYLKLKVKKIKIKKKCLYFENFKSKKAEPKLQKPAKKSGKQESTKAQQTPIVKQENDQAVNNDESNGI